MPPVLAALAAGLVEIAPSLLAGALVAGVTYALQAPLSAQPLSVRLCTPEGVAPRGPAVCA